MSDELVEMVASSMGPGDVDDLLRDALRILRETYAEAHHRSVSLTFSWSETSGRATERKLSWRLVADNESGYGYSRSEALRELREHCETAATVPVYGEQLANVLREMDDPWRRDQAVRHAQQILESERLRLQNARRGR